MSTPATGPRAEAPNEAERRSLRLWLQLMKASRTIEADIGGRLRRAYGQSLARFDVLSQLYRSDGEWVAIGALAERLMTASGNITALLDRMEAEGLVERRPSPTDRRSHQVRMTGNGLALFRSMTEDHARWVHDALSEVPDADKERLMELLVRIRRAFETPDPDKPKQ